MIYKVKCQNVDFLPFPLKKHVNYDISIQCAKEKYFQMEMHTYSTLMLIMLEIKEDTQKEMFFTKKPIREK